jgi:hypothetical protein
MAGRTRWGPAPFVLAVLAATGVAGRSDWPRWYATVVAGALLTVLAGAGTARVLADPAVRWGWVASGAIVSAAGVWVGVPETGPALLAGGAVAGLAAAARLTRSRWEPSGGLGVAAVLGWAALSGAAGQQWAAIGGSLCFGVAPWFAFVPGARRRSRSAGLALFGAHIVLVVLAARWIAVDPDAGWGRVSIVAAAGLAVAVVTYRRA